MVAEAGNPPGDCLATLGEDADRHLIRGPAES